MMEHLEQLYYTWSRNGLGGVTGLRVRAASNGVADIEGARYRSFEPYLGYALPQGSDSSRATKENSPYCLAFVNTEKEHIALQKVFTGKDAYGRAGVYFVHLLASFPVKPPKRKRYPKDYTDLDAIDFWGYTARDAIDLWMSGFWQTSVPDTSPVTLPTVPLDQLQLERLKGRLSEKDMPGISNDLEFVIAAFLSLEPNQKLYIAASPQRVAALIWGLAHSLPRTLQVGEEQHLTFSTYEQDVMKASMRVIGTCRSTEEAQNSSTRVQPLLPPECFNGQGLALDCYTNDSNSRHSQLPPDPDIANYAKYAVGCLVSHSSDSSDSEKKRELDAFLKRADRMKIDTKESFIAAIFIEKYLKEKGELNEDLVLGLFKNEELAMVWLPNEKVPQCIIKLAAKNPQWWQEKVVPPLKDLLRNAAVDNDDLKDALASFAEGVANVICDAMLADQETYARPALKMLQTLADPKVDFAPWLHLLHRFSARIAKEPRLHPGTIFRLVTRFYFLNLWAAGVEVIEPQHIRPWLPVNWDEFGKFLPLQQNIPQTWYAAATFYLLVNLSEPLPQESKEWMNKHRSIFEEALTGLMLTNQAQAALRFYRKLVDHKYKEKVALLSTLLNAATGEPEHPEAFLGGANLDIFLDAARMDNKEKLAFVEQNSRALQRHSGASGASPLLHQMIRAYIEKLEKLPWEKLQQVPIFNALWFLRKIRLPKDKQLALLVRHYSCMSVSLFAMADSLQLTIEETSLREIGEAIEYFGVQDNEEYWKYFFFLLVKHPRSQEELRCIVESLAPSFVEAQTKPEEAHRLFLSQLATVMGENYKRKYPYTWFMPYITLAFVYTAGLSDGGKKGYLEPLLEGLLKNADDNILSSIEMEITTPTNPWPGKYVEAWYTYRPHRRRKGVGEKVGDLIRKRPSLSTSETDKHKAQSKKGSQSQSDTSTYIASPQPQQGFQSQQNVNARQANIPQQPAHYQDVSRSQQPAPQVEVQSFPPSSINESPAPLPSGVRQAPSSRAAPQVVITEVNGIVITREWLETVFALKDMYISFRLDQLKHLFEEKRQKNEDVTWILDEQDELRYNYQTDRKYTLKVLQNDILIKHGIEEYGRPTPGTMSNIGQLVLDVYHEVRRKDKREYNKILAGKYTEKDVQDVLGVFARYRILAEYFVKQNISMKEWLEQQRFSAKVTVVQNDG